MPCIPDRRGLEATARELIRDGRGTAVVPYGERINGAAMRRDVWRRLIEDIGVSGVLLVGVLCPAISIWLAVRGWTTPEPYKWT